MSHIGTRTVLPGTSEDNLDFTLPTIDKMARADRLNNCDDGFSVSASCAYYHDGTKQLRWTMFMGVS